MFKIVLAILLFLLMTLPLSAQSLGLWVVRDGLTSPEKIEEIMDLSVKLNVDKLFVQVNGRAEAYYASQLVPRAPGIVEEFDPLEYALSLAKERGIQLHAWVNAYTISSFIYRSPDPNHVLNKHPHWIMVDGHGRSLADYDGSSLGMHLPAIMLEPGLPEVQAYLVQVIQEIVDNYPVDGIHLDYIRYPARNYGFSDYNREQFKLTYGVDPLNLAQNHPEELMGHWDDYRRDNVTALVSKISGTLKEAKVPLSAAVYADISDAFHGRFQDWPLWLEKGYLDFAVPMMYSTNTLLVENQIKNALEHVQGPLYIGLGAYALLDRPQVLYEKIKRVRSYPIAGVVLFSYNSIAKQPQILEIVEQTMGGM